MRWCKKDIAGGGGCLFVCLFVCLELQGPYWLRCRGIAIDAQAGYVRSRQLTGLGQQVHKLLGWSARV